MLFSVCLTDSQANKTTQKKVKTLKKSESIKMPLLPFLCDILRNKYVVCVSCQTSEKSKVVCVKFPAQSVDEAYLRKLIEPFGKIVKVLMFPSLVSLYVAYFSNKAIQSALHKNINTVQDINRTIQHKSI